MSCEFISFCAMSLSEQASWVQAVGSIIAIVVAIIIPLRAHRLSQHEAGKEKQNKAKILTVLALPVLYDLRAFIHGFAEEHSSTDEPFKSPYMPGKNLESLAGSFKALLISTNELGTIGEKLALLSANIFKINESHEEILRRQAGGYHAAYINLIPLVIGDLNSLIPLTNEIIEQIETANKIALKNA